MLRRSFPFSLHLYSQPNQSASRRRCLCCSSAFNGNREFCLGHKPTGRRARQPVVITENSSAQHTSIINARLAVALGERAQGESSAYPAGKKTDIVTALFRTLNQPLGGYQCFLALVYLALSCCRHQRPWPKSLMGQCTTSEPCGLTTFSSETAPSLFVISKISRNFAVHQKADHLPEASRSKCIKTYP
jgi:hypothetical protein